MTLTGERLESAMRRRGLDQSDLAERLGTSQATISRIVLGKTANSRWLPRIATELRFPLPWLQGVSDDDGLYGGDSDSPVTHQEQELLELFRGLDVNERGAIITLARSIATSARSSTMQAPQRAYRAQHDVRGPAAATPDQVLERALAEAMAGPLPRRPEARARYLASVVQQLIELPEDLASSKDSAGTGGKAARRGGDPVRRATKRA